MKTAQQRISEIKSQGYDMDFSNVFTTAFDSYKRMILQGGVAYLLAAIIILAIAFTVGLLTSGLSAFGKEMISFQVENLSAVNQILYIFGFSVVSGLGSPFSAGLMKMAYASDVNEEFSVGTAFEYYKGGKFLDIFLCGFLIAAVVITINTLMGIAAGMFWGPYVGLPINLIITFFTMVSIQLIQFGNLKPVDAIFSSCIVVFRNPWVILGLWIIAYILVCVGVIGLCIGIFFTLPFMNATYYAIYKHSVGIEDSSELNDIGMENL